MKEEIPSKVNLLPIIYGRTGKLFPMRCLVLREMGQWLGALSVLVEDPHGGYNSSSIGSDTHFGLREHIMCMFRMYTCRQTFTLKNFLKTQKSY